MARTNAPMAVRIKLLGVPHIRVGSETVKLPNRRVTLALLAYLVLRRGESLARSHVAFAIWPDEDEERALSELRRYLYKLRRLFPESTGDEPYLIVDDDTIAWNANAPCSLDIDDFERAAKDPANLAAAIALYDGDLIEEIYDDWAIAERERLRGMFFNALWSLVAQYRSRRDYSRAAATVQRLLAADPWREDAIRQLMAIRYEAGDAAGALAACDRFARDLLAEMQAEPMPETLALRETIVRGAPLASGLVSAKPADERERTDRQDAVPFVGRANELARLQELWDRSTAGHGALALIEGEAGAGKSRLVAELALVAEPQGARVLVGMTTSPEYRPYQALADALRSALPLLAAIDLPAPSLAALAELIPELRARRPELPELDRIEPAAERTRLFDALARTFVTLAKPRPVLLVLEDLQWASDGTIDALAFIAPRVAASSVAIVGTVRESEAGRAHSLRGLERSLRDSKLATRIALGPLDREAVDELVAAMLPDLTSRAELASIAFERSEGNAFFVTEILRDAASDGGGTLVVPASVRAMIGERAAQLTPATRAFADVAAIVGTAFDIDVVRDVSGVTLREAEAALDELIDRHIARELSPRNRNEFAFSHQLVRATLYDAVDPAARVRRHRRVARALDASPERLRDELAAEIAYHFERGEDARSAADAYLRAARHAVGLFANDQARAWAERGLDLHSEPDRLRFDLLLAYEEVVARVGDRTAQASALAELERLAQTFDAEAISIALERKILGARRSGDRAAELVAIESLDLLARERDDAKRLAYVLESRGMLDIATFQSASALRRALEVAAQYEALDDRAGVFRGIALASLASADLGDAEGATRYAGMARAIADELGDARLRMSALRNEARAAQARQDNARFAEVALATLALCRATGDRDAEAHAHFQLGSASWALWAVDAGVSHLRSAVDIFEQLGSSRVASATGNLAVVLLDVGCFSEARALLARSEEAALEAGLDDTLIHGACNLAELAWICGDGEGLREASGRGLAVARRLAQPRQKAVAEVAESRNRRCAGDAAGALAAGDRALAVFEEISRPFDVIEVLYERALTNLVAGDLAAARESFERAAKLVREHGEAALQYPIRYCWAEACVAHASGDDACATRALERGARFIADRARAIGDTNLRAAFEAIPYHRALHAARAGTWPRLDCCPIFFASALVLQ